LRLRAAHAADHDDEKRTWRTGGILHFFLSNIALDDDDYDDDNDYIDFNIDTDN